MHIWTTNCGIFDDTPSVSTEIERDMAQHLKKDTFSAYQLVIMGTFICQIRVYPGRHF